MVTIDFTCARIVSTSSITPRETGGSLLTIGQAASRFNLHPNTLRRLCDSGRLPAYVMPSGHRRIKTADLLAYMGAKPEEIKQEGSVCVGEDRTGTAKIALLARVSSEKQGKGFDSGNGCRKVGSEIESDLERQVGRLREYARTQYGCESPAVYSDIGSGLNFNRKGFTRLLEEVLLGKWKGGVILSTYKDRVCRNGFELVELICKAGGAKLEIIEGAVEESDEEELSRDVLALVTHYSAKVHGLRAAKNNTLNLSPEGTARAKELRDAGYTIAHICKVMSREGFTCQSEGRKEPQAITKWVLSKVFQGEKAKLLEVALPAESGKTSWEVFAEERLEKREGKKENLWAKDIYLTYVEFCRKRGEQPVTKLVAGLWLKTRYPRRFIGGYAQYQNIGWKNA